MSCYDKILWRPQEGETIKMDKLIINKAHDTQLNVVVATIEHVDGETHFVLSLGTYEEIRIVGDQEWNQFLKFVTGLNWDQEDTGECEIFDHEENLPFAEEVEDNPWPDTVETPTKNLIDTLELPILE